MKVLLTGASGFVGSHVLDALLVRAIPTCVLLRSSSSDRFLPADTALVGRCIASLEDPASLAGALRGVTHVIHCAGATRASSSQGFFEVNQLGTRKLLRALDTSSVRRFIYVSSLAAAGPASRDCPSREDAAPAPVSVYGRSKLAGEHEVADTCPVAHVIVRPPAVYGPRDGEFLKLFKMVKSHILPLPAPQPLSMVYVQDLAQVIVSCLEHPAAANRTLNVAADEVVTAGQMARQIAGEMDVSALTVPVPTLLLWPFCLFHQARSWVTGVPGVLSLQKYAELKAKGWVCDSSRMRKELGMECPTLLRQGIARTLRWYRENDWL